MKIYTENVGGNVHEAAGWVNKMDAAEHLVQIDFNGGYYSIVVLKLPDDHPLLLARAKRQEEFRSSGRMLLGEEGPEKKS